MNREQAIENWLSGCLPPAAEGELVARLKSDPTALQDALMQVQDARLLECCLAPANLDEQLDLALTIVSDEGHSRRIERAVSRHRRQRHRRQRKKVVRLVVPGVALAAGLLLTLLLGSTVADARAEFVEGRVTVNEQTIATGQWVPTGVDITTGADARVALAWHDDKVTAASGTAFMLHPEGYLKQSQGSIRARVVPRRSGDTPFSVLLPQARAVAIGTDFTTTVSAELCHLAVHEGAVVFHALDATAGPTIGPGGEAVIGWPRLTTKQPLATWVRVDPTWTSWQGPEAFAIKDNRISCTWSGPTHHRLTLELEQTFDGQQAVRIEGQFRLPPDVGRPYLEFTHGKQAHNLRLDFTHDQLHLKSRAGAGWTTHMRKSVSTDAIDFALIIDNDQVQLILDGEAQDFVHRATPIPGQRFNLGLNIEGAKPGPPRVLVEDLNIWMATEL